MTSNELLNLIFASLCTLHTYSLLEFIIIKQEVEDYVEHVWQISSDKIKCLENENDFLKTRLLVLDRIPSSSVTSDGVVNSDALKEPKHGLMSLFKS